jgi:hypothetical protein
MVLSNGEIAMINYINKLEEENKALKHENKVKYDDLVKYEGEIQFLKQRNKELRQKTWIKVYEENIILQEKLKVRQEQLRQSAEISDGFYCRMMEVEKENRHLKEVIDSVQTFIEQFAK